MSDQYDDATFSDSPSLPRGPRDPDPSFDDDLERLIVQPTPFPVLMLISGSLWILAGATYVLFFAILRLLKIPFESSDVWLALGAFFFVKDGVQLIRGKFRDPKGDGVITIVVALYVLGEAIVRFTSTGDVLVLALGVGFGLIFIAPGILVLIGRKQYLHWLAEQSSSRTDADFNPG